MKISLFKKNKEVILNHKLLIIIFVLIILISNIELPFYIRKTGGIINLENRVEVNNNNKKKGTLNLVYVSEIKATIPFLIISKFNKDWQVISKNKENNNETQNEIDFRNKILLNEANNTAILVAYNKANKEVFVKKQQVYIIYIDKNSKTNLKIKDEVISIDNIKIHNAFDISKIISSHNVNDKINIKVKNNNIIYNRYAYVIKYKNKKIIGVVISNKYNLITNPKVKFNFNNSESGSSGGLMMTLEIYNSLISNNIKKGRKIAGTGAIDVNGDVGEIDGIKFKLKAAILNKADIFLVPKGENSKEAFQLKKKYNYKIKIKAVKNIDEAIDYLKK